jgi:tetratricopeptide (TPR) repeat protein
VAKLERQLGRTLSDADVSRYFTGLALDYMRSDPLGVLRLLGRKTLLFWGPLEVSHNKVEEAEREHSPLLRTLPVRFSLALALALLGGALLWLASRRERDGHRAEADSSGAQEASSPQEGRSKRRSPASGSASAGQLRTESTALLLMLIGAWWISFLPFFVAARYRAPIVPLLLGFSAFALYQLWRWARARDFKRAGLALAMGAAVFFVVDANWIGYRIDRARWHYARGRGYSASDQMDEAIAEFRRTLEINPNFSAAHVDLGVALAMRRAWDESYRHLEQAAQLEPDNPFARQNLAGVLEVQGHLEEAREHFEAAARLKPTWSKPRLGLARIEQALEQRAADASGSPPVKQ